MTTPHKHEIGYREFGTGPHRVLVLHGWFGDERFLDPILPAIDGERFAYVCMAYRGYGASAHLTGEYTLQEASRDALNLTNGLGWQDFSVVGHSMGGKVAQRIAVDAPAKVRRIVAVTPVGAGAVPLDAATRALFAGAQYDPEKRFRIIDHSTGGRLSRRWIQGMVERSQARSRPEAFGAYFRAWADTNFAAAVANMGLPVRVVVGQYDQSITPAVANAAFSSLYRDCVVEVIENAGHYPADEVPIIFATVLERLLSE
jgi:pimeloyl-ACP methyl ester carboxylesterase